MGGAAAANVAPVVGGQPPPIGASLSIKKCSHIAIASPKLWQNLLVTFMSGCGQPQLSRCVGAAAGCRATSHICHLPQYPPRFVKFCLGRLDLEPSDLQPNSTAHPGAAVVHAGPIHHHDGGHPALRGGLHRALLHPDLHLAEPVWTTLESVQKQLTAEVVHDQMCF